jgi:hypothetical protein
MVLGVGPPPCQPLSRATHAQHSLLSSAIIRQHPSSKGQLRVRLLGFRNQTAPKQTQSLALVLQKPGRWPLTCRSSTRVTETPASPYISVEPASVPLMPSKAWLIPSKCPCHWCRTRRCPSRRCPSTRPPSAPALRGGRDLGAGRWRRGNARRPESLSKNACKRRHRSRGAGGPAVERHVVPKVKDSPRLRPSITHVKAA